MTFGAMAAWQAWALVIGASGIAAWLFFIKVRPPRMPVPSLMLWRRVLDDPREQTLWERIRRAVSLAVTILVALMLALAAMRPAPRARGGGSSSGRVLVVLDSSWSMLARTNSGETRWERAVAQARRITGGGSGSEFALATTADGIVEGPTSDHALIEAALDRLEPAGGDATSWPRLPASDAVHFVTDGAVVRALATDVVVHSVFEPAPNVGITAFGVRPSIVGGNAGEAYLEVANYAAAAQPVRIVLTRGTASLIDRRVDLAPGEALRLVIPLARGADAVLEAKIDGPENALDIDDEAFAWIERARPLQLTIVGEDTAWLSHLFEDDPRVRATIVAPEAYPKGTERADVLIFDRWGPNDAPARPALFVAPPSGRRVKAEEIRPRWDAPGSHPVVLGVDPFTLTIEKARAYELTGLVPVARSTRGTPLVYVSEPPNRRAVLITFGPGESNLTAAPAFPVLIGNALEWLSTPTPPQTRRPGLAIFEDGVSEVTGTRGVQVPLARVHGAVVGHLRAPGLYVAQGGGARATIAVTVGDPEVSNLLKTTIGATSPASPVRPGTSREPWWVYLALAAFGLALVEWWTWQRRITV